MLAFIATVVSVLSKSYSKPVILDSNGNKDE